MKACFHTKEDAVEYRKLKSATSAYRMRIFPSPVDYAHLQKLNKEMGKLEGKGLVLWEPWSDFIPKMKSTSHKGKYGFLRAIEKKKYPLGVTEEQLGDMIKELQGKYPKKGYRMEVAELWAIRGRGVGKVRFHVIKRGDDELNNPPMYFDLKSGRCYIPKHIVESRPRLASAVVLYRLRPLGAV